MAAVVAAAAAGTILLLRLIGTTPYSDASLFIEVVDVPVTEELVFRAVLLTALLVILRRLWSPATTVALAIIIDAIAFGTAHLANLTITATMFTVGQALFATVLGGLCAVLMVPTQERLPRDRTPRRRERRGRARLVTVARSDDASDTDGLSRLSSSGGSPRAAAVEGASATMGSSR